MAFWIKRINWKLLFIVFLFPTSGCQNPIKNKLSPYYCKFDIKSISILDKTTNSDTVRKVEVKDADDIKKFCYAINSLKEFPDARLKANYGFYEIELHLQNGENYHMSVIHTLYDGIVITDNRLDYKNDDMEALVSNLLQ